MLSWRTSNDNNVETFDVMYDNMLLEITQLTTRCVAAETQNELFEETGCDATTNNYQTFTTAGGGVA